MEDGYQKIEEALSVQRREPSEELATFLLVSQGLGIWKLIWTMQLLWLAFLSPEGSEGCGAVLNSR